MNTLQQNKQEFKNSTGKDSPNRHWEARSKTVDKTYMLNVDASRHKIQYATCYPKSTTARCNNKTFAILLFQSLSTKHSHKPELMSKKCPIFYVLQIANLQLAGDIQQSIHMLS